MNYVTDLKEYYQDIKSKGNFDKALIFNELVSRKYSKLNNGLGNHQKVP